MMQYEKLLNNIERLKRVKEVLDAKGINLSDGDELCLQHINAFLNSFIDVVKLKKYEA